MTGKGHSATTMAASAAVVVAGSALVPLGLTSPAYVLLAVCFVLAGALRPDIDHLKATATYHLSVISLVSCHLWRSVARSYYEATRTAEEPPESDPHRKLTHTIPGALLIGSLSGLHLSGLPYVWAVSLAAAFAGADPVATARWIEGAALVGPGIAVWVVASLAVAPWFWSARLLIGLVAAAGYVAALQSHTFDPTTACVVAGLACAFGCVCHDLGDSVTTTGAPLAHPMLRTERHVAKKKAKGQTLVSISEKTGRWIEVGPPRLLRFPTGGYREKVFIALVCAGSGYLCFRMVTDPAWLTSAFPWASGRS